MADPSQDVLSPEDVDALIHTQQHLFSSGDPRAAQLYNYITQQGYATKDAQGGLVRSNQASLQASPTWGQQAQQMIAHPLDSLEAAGQLTSRPANATMGEMAASDLSNFAAGGAHVLRHPIDTATQMLTSGFGARPLVESAENAIVQAAGRPAPNPNAQVLPQGPEQAAYGMGQAAMTAGIAKNAPLVAKAAPIVADAMSQAADLPQAAPAQTIPGQNYAQPHAAAFEGALAPATGMGKNFTPQSITPQALSPIRQTASRMAQGSPLEQVTVQAATNPSTPPLTRLRAYQGVVQSALNDLEAQHAQGLASAADVPVSVDPLVQELRSHISPTTDPADVSAIQNLIQRTRQVRTIGDLNTFRQELNNETSAEFKQSQIQAGRSGTSVQAASDLAGAVRGAYYDNLGQATGVNYAPLKLQESNLLTTKEALQNQQSMLAKQEATFNAPSTLREKAGNVANVIQNPKATVTQTILRESPATRISTLLQKSLADLPPAPSSARLLPAGAPTPMQLPPPGGYESLMALRKGSQ